MHIDRSGRTLLDGVLDRYVQDYQYKFNTRLGAVTINENPFAPTLQLQEPPAVRSYCDLVRDARGAVLALPKNGGDLDDSYRTVIRDALVWERLMVARRVEVHRTCTIDPELTAEIRQQLEPYDQLMGQRWLRETPETSVPQLRDYFPLYNIEEEEGEAEAGERLLDEKFHILQAPAQFHADLHAARAAGQLRGISCAVGYLDVDNFKGVNQAYNEPFVDLNILPKLMRTLEAHLFQRGHAYRFGGDEYGLLIHNTSQEDAARLLHVLRRSIEQLTFYGTKPSFGITASIGFLVIGPRCHLTGLEIEARAASAKQFAKLEGKNRVAVSEAPWFDTSRLEPD
jgi:diguanylate cyclase (GGDEF)-like protein